MTRPRPLRRPPAGLLCLLALAGPVAAQQTSTTAYQYDANGNRTRITDPLGHITQLTYDGLNRLTQRTDPLGGLTQYAYNGQDRLTQVTDPRSLATAYSLDGLGNLTQQSSPDTGLTQFGYDLAGNPTSRTDAKGQVTSTQYDALNRPLLISYAGGRQESYTWDQGTHGIGRLTQIDELQNGQLIGRLQYTYDAQGRRLSETRTEGPLTLGTGYTWTQGLLASLTYPSGKQVSYGRDSQGRISQITLTDNGQVKVLISQVQYHPFGGIKSYVTGAGQSITRMQDLDGRITAYSLGGSLWQVGYDAAARIQYQTDTSNAANTVSYGYDALDRLTGSVLPSTSVGYGYDATGNRTSQTLGGTSYSYAISAGSNRLASVTTSPPRSYSYDANGSQTGDGQNQWSYDGRGRLSQAVTQVGTTTYRIDALGRRVGKTNTTEDTRYVYDLGGHLLAETDATGHAKREYIWLEELPVGVLK